MLPTPVAGLGHGRKEQAQGSDCLWSDEGFRNARQEFLGIWRMDMTETIMVPRVGRIGNPVKIRSGPATVTEEDARQSHCREVGRPGSDDSEPGDLPWG